MTAYTNWSNQNGATEKANRGSTSKQQQIRFNDADIEQTRKRN